MKMCEIAEYPHSKADSLDSKIESGQKPFPSFSSDLYS